MRTDVEAKEKTPPILKHSSFGDAEAFFKDCPKAFWVLKEYLMDEQDIEISDEGELRITQHWGPLQRKRERTLQLRPR